MKIFIVSNWIGVAHIQIDGKLEINDTNFKLSF